jgi:hypothetical protein
VSVIGCKPKGCFRAGYESLFKSGNNPNQQLEKLIKKANQAGHIPLYCFYNFQHPDGDFYAKSYACLHHYKPPSFWGCSIALAQDVEFANSDSLKNLRGYMVPWHLLACIPAGAGLADAAIGTARLLAEPKGEWSVVEDTIRWERPRRELPISTRNVPDYVSEMVEIQSRACSGHLYA